MKPQSSLTPKYREWALKHGTPWEVYFPKLGTQSAKRRYFSTQEEAQKEIDQWEKGRKPDAILGRRVVDEVTYWQGQLPEGVTIGDCVRYYLDHHSGSKVTLGDLCAAVLNGRKKKSAAYRKTIYYSCDLVLKELGKTTEFVSVSRGRWIKFIRSSPEYWDQYNRKRIAGLIVTEAINQEAIKTNILDGFSIGEPPKKTPHFLSNRDAQVILEYFCDHHPELAPACILQIFLGIRTAELSRKDEHGKRALCWSDIAWGKKVDVALEVSKTGYRRVIDWWPEALDSYLSDFRKVEGRICPECDFGSIKSNIIENLNEERKLEKLPLVDFQKNDFRHTTASNMVGFFQDASKAQLYLGQESKKVLWSNYRDYVTEESAKAFYSLKRQNGPSNVITLTA